MHESSAIVLDTLPTVAVNARQSLPPESAVYFALSDTGRVLYIGATVHLQRRWRWHETLQKLAELQCATIAYHLCRVEELNTLECAMIAHYTPPLNAPRFIPSHHVYQNIKAAHPTGIRMSSDDKGLLRALARQSGITMTAVLELLIRQEAKTKGLNITTVDHQEK